ncbi:MAG: CidA/LrgA family protein [Lachnospiraceae bacterium]|jgi:holin-like protein|nr:CidA/LrgA family protein [Lachnospiraceae bacterium]
MLYLRQFCIILFVSFLGELLYVIIPLPIPASVYGLVLMLAALCTGIIRLNQVKETAGFLIEIMPVMFIPAAAGLLNSWSLLRPVWIPFIVITLVSTIIVMGVTGQITQRMIQKDMKNGEKDERISG